jgi:hypothetical protein
METGVVVKEAVGERITIGRDGETESIEADAVVLARQPESDSGLAETLAHLAPVAVRVGDCAQPGKLMEAVASGYLAGQAV